MIQLTAFTDGACSPNPGPGGWGAIIRVHGAPDIELSGFDPATTNNRMELMGPIMVLERFVPRCDILIVSDSKYVVRGATEWMSGWRGRGWKRTRGGGGGQILNLNLWQRLDAAMSLHQVRFQWVRGHNGHPENERADALAVRAMLSGRTRKRAVA
ncbi:MAG: ribonuclease HI [Patescibacteria group bacterium]|nr:ribonuclease HI [Patescibacteria group bacterium]